MAMNGIDVSSYQSGLDLDAISYDFVMIKATQGTDYVNPYCDAHFEQAKAQGKKLAVYHYADGNDAIAEADWFVDNCAGYIGQAIFLLDWEGEGVEYTDWANRFLQHVESRIGYKPTIYMSESVENGYDWSAVVAGDYGLVVAKYSDYEIDNNYDTSGAGQAPVTKYWPFYFMWQWTSKGRLNGYAGDLDCDIFYGSPETWDAYAGTTATPVKTDTPPQPQPQSQPQPVPVQVKPTPPPPPPETPSIPPTVPNSPNSSSLPSVNTSNDTTMPGWVSGFIAWLKRLLKIN